MIGRRHIELNNILGATYRDWSPEDVNAALRWHYADCLHKASVAALGLGRLVESDKHAESGLRVLEGN